MKDLGTVIGVVLMVFLLLFGVVVIGNDEKIARKCLDASLEKARRSIDNILPSFHEAMHLDQLEPFLSGNGARTYNIIGVEVEGLSFWWCADHWVQMENPCEAGGCGGEVP